MIYDKTRDRYPIYDKNRRAQIYDKSEDETITTQSIIKQETEKTATRWNRRRDDCRTIFYKTGEENFVTRSIQVSQL